MSDELDGTVAIVTGAAQGIGRAIAEVLLERNAKVVLADLNLDTCRLTAAELDKNRVLALYVDVRLEASIREAFDTAERTFGTANVLINNAARTSASSIAEITVEEWDDVVATNLRGTFFGCRVAGERMGDSGGRIVNLASLAGQWGRSPTGVDYAATKAGIIALTRVFAHQLAPRGITVNAVAPGPIDGPQVRTMAPERVANYVSQMVPVGRLGQPREIAETIGFVVSGAAGFMTGATIDVNGGAVMR